MRPTHPQSFDELADAYRRFRVGYAPELYEILEHGGVARGTSVLDVGCGTGIVSQALANRGCAVTGVDVSQAMLEHAREAIPGATFLEGSSEALPFADDSFDAAVSAQAFHWFDQQRALAEMIRVVRGGGTVAVWWKGMMRGDATRLIRESVASELGLISPPDLLTAEFGAFEASGLEDRRLRVIPWIVQMTAERYLGYEFSRARARAAYGDRLEEYLERLEERIGSRDAQLSISYVQLVYLGRVPERSA
jgi:ubiquinone/menaquinone biosynthesis C-methylase UbiE